MKQLFILALSAAAIVGCTKDVTPEGGVDVPASADIQISTAASTKGVTPDYAIGGRNNFFPGDQLGIYLANSGAEVASDYTFADAEDAINFQYTFSTPFWSPVDGENGKLKYPTADAGAKKAQLFAYFPYQSATPIAGNPLTTPVTQPVFAYKLPLDQTTDATSRLADLMWAKATGATANAGYELSTNPINLTFTHQMAKLSFTLELKNTATGVTAQTRYLRAFAVKGPEVKADQAATFNVVTGKLDAKANAKGVAGSIYYLKGTENDLTMLSATTAAPFDAGKPFQYTDGDGKVTNTFDLLVYPFTQTKDVNTFYIYLSEDQSTNYADIAAVEAAFEAGTIDVFSASIPAPVGSTADLSSAKNIFAAGVANKYKVTIDLANAAVNITTTITPWGEVDNGNIDAE